MSKELSADYISDESENILMNFLNSSRISTDFPKHEKRAIWDGFIIVYKDSNRTKDGEQRIPVQIKGTTTYFPGIMQIEKTDLKAYQSEQGCLFFVVVMQKKDDEILKDNAKIYVAELSRNKIDKYLAKCEGNSIGVKLKLLTREDVLPLCRDFLYKRKCFNDYEYIEPTDIDQIEKIKITSFEKHNSISSLSLNDEVIGLASIRGRKKDKIIEISNLTSTEQIFKPVTVGNLVYYEQFEKIETLINTRLVIDKDIIIEERKTSQEDKDGVKSNFSLIIKQGDYLNKTIRQLNFIIALLEAKQLSVGDESFTVIPNSDMIEKYKQEHTILTKIKKFIEKFDIADMSIKNISHNQIMLVNDLFNDELTNVVPSSGFCILNFGDLVLLTNVIDEGNGRHNIENAFNYLLLPYKKSNYGCPLFLYFNSNILLTLSNVNYEKLQEAIASYKVTRKKLVYTSNFLLNLIDTYDKTENIKWLILSEFLCSKLKKLDKNLWLINITQIKKRKGENIDNLLKQISEELKNSESKETLIFQCCANILLENKYEVKKCIEKLSEEEFKNLQNWPIYKLYKNGKES